MTDSSASEDPGLDPDVSASETAPVAAVSLPQRVHAGFSRANRERIPLDEVEAILDNFDLADPGPARRVPLLRLVRLRFTGEKRKRGDAPRPIQYDQSFSPGVNVVLIEGNGVGKSSVMKTIKVALTGNDDDYDVDVREWIHDIWLTFSLDDHLFTVVVSRLEMVKAVLVLGEEDRRATESAESQARLWAVDGKEGLQEELRKFFFDRFNLSPLSWTVQASPTAAITTPRTSWLTYFQALQIVDDRYLLCDPAHNFGNQEGLILSAFLGLRLAEPMNRLAVEAQQTRKERTANITRTADETREMEVQIAGHEGRLTDFRSRIDAIDAVQQRRRDAIRAAPPATRLVELQTTLFSHLTERTQLLEEREDLRQRIRRSRADARRLNEAVRLRLHFTGLTVQICPGCDQGVADDAVAREEDEHLCRLCGRLPSSAPADEVTEMETQAAAAADLAEELSRSRDELSRRIRELDQLIASARTDIELLQGVIEQGIDAALPTREEEAERMRLAQEIGSINATIQMLRAHAMAHSSDKEPAEKRERVLEKARDILRQDAEALNTDILREISALTQELVGRIGADSIGDLTVRPFGTVQFTKNDVPVVFGRLRNQGDQLRVKLSFFLAMMRLGRKPGLGRHPGLLLIDQPGAAEMVDEDFAALADVFRGVDADLANETQIICFTARPVFARATTEGKLYGP